MHTDALGSRAFVSRALLCSTPAAFDEWEASYEAMCGRGLEGIVAKSNRSLYRAGKRGWIETKNPA
jgi:ATP-dependent DNA ligase